MTDRQNLETLASHARDLLALQKTQRLTQAQRIRACIKQLRKPEPAEREKAIIALGELADMLEKE